MLIDRQNTRIVYIFRFIFHFLSCVCALLPVGTKSFCFCWVNNISFWERSNGESKRIQWIIYTRRRGFLIDPRTHENGKLFPPSRERTKLVGWLTFFALILLLHLFTFFRLSHFQVLQHHNQFRPDFSQRRLSGQLGELSQQTLLPSHSGIPTSNTAHTYKGV